MKQDPVTEKPLATISSYCVFALTMMGLTLIMDFIT